MGYLRVSGTDQVLDLQRDALAAAGCSRVWEEVASGAKKDRPELLDLLGHLRAGDTLVVWRLDRLGRSLSHLIETVEGLQERGVAFKSLTETIDTSSPGGMLIFQIAVAKVSLSRKALLSRLARPCTARHGSGADRVAGEVDTTVGGRLSRTHRLNSAAEFGHRMHLTPPVRLRQVARGLLERTPQLSVRARQALRVRCPVPARFESPQQGRSRCMRDRRRRGVALTAPRDRARRPQGVTQVEKDAMSQVLHS
nr:recombinase family protein [Rhodococcus oxybenzonivorans]